ncbi:succinate-semialdehyde dehydrogenase / glutarate-semialdehyde dehydrogenase, partial [Paracidovorax cattleyae]
MTTSSSSPASSLSAARPLVRSQLYIAGRWQAAAGGATFAVTDPATGDT